MSLDKEVVGYLARERGIDPAFIEKDWYAVRVLKTLSNYSFDDITIIFTGGTSLSKGYDLLKRFSEDLDFRARFDVEYTANQLKKKRRAFRQGVIDVLEAIEDVAFDESDVEMDGLGFKIRLTYPQLSNVPDGIRPDLQVEFSFTQPRLDAEYREISSFVADYKNEPAETGFLCLSPVEIAADKFSALVWRVLKRNRADEKDDPAMLRHLHDLYALQGIISRNQELVIQTALESFALDQERQNRNVGMSLAEASVRAYERIREDVLYRAEYQQFVDEMSYADDDEVISFDSAAENFKLLTGLFE